ncbi:MAG: hypothetical protein MUE52_11385 [Tabrizicola sp.]|jgi:hypothetical protein|nr:hypothetical protein [Tabrizicola sp.]
MVAVLTGDLVGSSKHPAEMIDAAMQAIRDTAFTIGGWHSPPQDTRFTRFRGDGWQIVLADPAFALRAAVVIQARQIALDMESRIFIGVGSADNLGTGTLADASGEAFARSGQGLDKMGENWRLGIDGDTVRVEDQLVADLLGERMGRWTSAQAEAAAMQLATPARITTLHEIGKALRISPQAVNDRVRGAGCATIASVLRRWEAQKVRDGWGNSK